VREDGRGDLDHACVPSTVAEMETQLNGRDHFVHRSSGSGQQIYVEQVGQCLPAVVGHHVREHGSASSVGSVASSAKLSAAGNLTNRPSHCASSSSDIANSFVTAPRDEVSDISPVSQC